jgi:hypothetical protein
MQKHIIIVGGRARGKTTLIKEMIARENKFKIPYFLSQNDHNTDSDFFFQSMVVDTQTAYFDSIKIKDLNKIMKLADSGILVNRVGKTSFQIWPSIVISIQSETVPNKSLLMEHATIHGFYIIDKDLQPIQ